MEQRRDIGAYFRERRVARGLSLRALAERTGVSKSALSDWERGASAPSLVELDAVLAAFGVGGRERRELLSAMDTPRARREVRRLELSDYGATLDTVGAVLRAMRVRRGLALPVAARMLGVDDSTVGRWESGAVRPSSVRLREIAARLGAAPAERALLAKAEAGPRRPPDLDAIAGLLSDFRHSAWGQKYPEFLDLHFIEIAASLRGIVGTSRAAEELYRIACGYIAHLYVMNHGSYEAAVPFATRALARDDGTLNPTDLPWAVHVLAHSASLRGRGGAERAISFMEEWIPRAEHDPRIAIWFARNLAGFLFDTGDLDRALALSAETVERTLASDEDPREAKADHAVLLIKTGRPAEALPYLPAPSPSPPYPTAYLAILWTHALLGAGERDAAAAWFATACDTARDHAITTLRPKLDELERRF